LISCSFVLGRGVEVQKEGQSSNVQKVEEKLIKEGKSFFFFFFVSWWRMNLERYKRSYLSSAVSDIEKISSSYDANDIQFSFEDLTEGGGVDDSIDEEQPFLFDVAWEVARKVGGIYTVRDGFYFLLLFLFLSTRSSLYLRRNKKLKHMNAGVEIQSAHHSERVRRFLRAHRTLQRGVSCD